MNALNVPIEIIERYKGSKSQKELLSLSIAVKCIYSNSVITNLSVKKIMTLFHVSNAKAKRLIQDAKQDSFLFEYSEKYNQLRAKTFKNKDEKTAKNGMKYFSAFSYKLEKKNYSIGELYKLLNEILIKNAINAVERDNFTQGHNNQNRCADSKTLTQRKLGNIAGISRASAARLANKLAANGVISKTKAIAKMVISAVNKATVAAWRKQTGLKNFIYNPKDNSGWIVQPCLYSIVNRSETERFKHVIFNHDKRVSAFNRSEKVNNVFDLPAMGIFFRVFYYENILIYRETRRIYILHTYDMRMLCMHICVYGYSLYM